MGVLRCRNVPQSAEVHLEELAKGCTDGNMWDESRGMSRSLPEREREEEDAPGKRYSTGKGLEVLGSPQRDPGI